MSDKERRRANIARDRYIYRCKHLSMEGTCEIDHGPRGVDVGPLSVDICPVTNADYAGFVAATSYAPSEPGTFLQHWVDGIVPDGLEDHPVVWVSPEDARAYASWAGGRLPTDEEWQYIAAGPDGNVWPWGADFDPSLCNHDGGELSAVTANPDGASWCGCQDLSGNAWEWTDSILDDGMHLFALIRGGSYYYAPGVWHVGGGARRCDYHWKLQLMNTGINRAETVGFRCVYEVTP